MHDVPCSLTTQDSISGRNDFVFGTPVWRPDDGMVGGALQFDGIDDCVITSTSILNPVDGVFSVLAWIKGGTPGQAIISQQVASDWFLMDGQRQKLNQNQLTDESNLPRCLAKKRIFIALF